MKIDKGIVKNINRKLIAGGLALTLVTSAGCTTINNIKYKRDEQGYITGIDGTVSYNILKDCGIFEVQNKVTQEKYYTIIYSPGYFYSYDLFTRQIINKDAFEFHICDNVTVCLNGLNKIKEEYTEEELREILNEYVSTQEKNKQFVKE